MIVRPFTLYKFGVHPCSSMGHVFESEATPTLPQQRAVIYHLLCVFAGLGLFVVLGPVVAALCTVGS